MKCAAKGGFGAALLEFAFDALDRRAEIPVFAAPTRRIDARRAVQRVDAKPGIVGEGGESRGLRRRPRLQQRIAAKRRLGLLRLGQAEFAGAHRVDAVRPEQLPQLPQLAGIVRGDDQPPLDFARAHARAAFCKATRSATPFCAKPSSDCSSCGENTATSAVAWISTRPPAPVMTKLASVCAVESSA